jgi:hypothetical protein
MAARVAIAVVVVVALAVAVVASGWLDDRAPPGSRGRVPVSSTATTSSP